MEIRTITLDDHHTLIKFWEDNYFIAEIDDASHFITFLEKNPGLSVYIEENGEVIGTALGSYDGRRGYLQKVVVSKVYRKQGIGKQLVDEVMRRLNDIGALYIPISVDPENVSFYEGCGFVTQDSISMSKEF